MDECTRAERDRVLALLEAEMDRVKTPPGYTGSGYNAALASLQIVAEQILRPVTGAAK